MAQPPRHVYLTWQREDCCRTMTVNFQYRDARADWGEVRCGEQVVRGKPTVLQLAGERRSVYHLTLEGLAPGTEYAFQAGRPGRLSAALRFRTPGTDKLRFAAGGDVYMTEVGRELFRLAGAYDPDFALVGGDICYEEGQLGLWSWWDRWLDRWNEHLRGEKGRLIPMVLAIGNHDVHGGWEQTPRQAPFYFQYLAQDPKSYFLRRFGPASILCLDSGHVTTHDGPQTRWLGEALATTADQPFVFACYHVPLYPSLEPFSLLWARLGRTHWAPLFDKHRLTAAFEHHEHTYKRSHPIKGGKIAAAGTVYLGDGAWGQAPRALPQALRWYEARHGSTNHFWLVDVSPDRCVATALGRGGKVIDKVEFSPQRP